MYSVNSAVNSILSCNAVSTRLLSWVSLNCSETKEVLGTVKVHVILKPFLWSSSLFQTSYPIVNWPLRSSIELYLGFFPWYRQIVLLHHLLEELMQQSDHGFWHCETILTESLSIDVHPDSFTNKNRNGTQCHWRLWSWLFLRNKFPCNSVLNVFQRHGFWRFRWHFEPKKLFCLEKWIRPWFRFRDFVMKADLHIQDWADFRVSENPSSFSGRFIISKQCILSKKILHFIWSFFIECDEELSFFNNLQTGVEAQFG